jgi:hypothetical protein
MNPQTCWMNCVNFQRLKFYDAACKESIEKAVRMK